jgi:hypothetical protein
MKKHQRKGSGVVSGKALLKLPGGSSKPLTPTGKIRIKGPNEVFDSLRQEQVDNLCGKGKYPVVFDFHEDYFALKNCDFLEFCKDVVKEFVFFFLFFFFLFLFFLTFFHTNILFSQNSPPKTITKNRFLK